MGGAKLAGRAAAELHLGVIGDATLRSTSTAHDDLWTRVDELVDRATRLSDLRVHGLHLLAARRWRRLGFEIPSELRAEELHYACLTLSMPLVLEKVRAAYAGKIVLIKGPAVASLYPDPLLRPTRDLDLVVDDAESAQRALLAAGFVETGPAHLFQDIHHLRPLRYPGLPVPVEIHRQPKWIEGLAPPPREELLSAAVPAVCGVEGILALPPAHHALVLAAHAWAHAPLDRIIHLLDIAAVSADVDHAEVDKLAKGWEVGRLWASTFAAANALLGERETPWPLRLWARNVAAVRERTVIESHAEKWLSPFWALPLPLGLRIALAGVRRQLRLVGGESVASKLNRSAHAVRNAFVRMSDHQRELNQRSRS